MGYGKEDQNQSSESPLGALSRPTPSEDEFENGELEDLDGFDETDGDEDWDGDHDVSDDPDELTSDTRDPVTPARLSAPRRGRSRSRASQSGGGAGKALGILIALAGIGVAVAGGMQPELRTTIEGFGVAPTSLVVLGVAIAYLSSLGRRLGQQEVELNSLADSTEFVAAQAEQTESQLGFLVENGGTGGSTSDEGIQQVIHLIQRQEEKIGNLSKATKMYGKPLLEITNQIGETSRQIAEIESKLNAVKIIVEQSTNRLENAMRDHAPSVGTATDGGAAAALPSDGLQRLEQMQRDMAQRLVGSSDDLGTEVRDSVRKSMRMLEEVRDELSGEVAKETEKLTKELAVLGMHVEQARDAILDEVKNAPASSGDAPAHDDMLDGIAQQLDGLSKAIDGMQSSIPAAVAAPAAGGETADAAAGSSNGGSSGVMSAIEKLKQMRQ